MKIKGPLAFGALHLAVCLYWLHVKLGTFYYYRADDVSRIAMALEWAKHPMVRPIGDWLPFPEYFLGSILALHHDPHRIPLDLNLLLSSASLAFAGLIALEIFPELPAVGLLAAALACRIPYFELVSFSAGSEAGLWFFLLSGAYFWMLYRRRGLARFAFLSGAALFLASGIRYESWIYIGALLFAAGLELRGMEKNRRLPAALLALPLLYIGFFIYYQEHHFWGMTRETFRGLPLSWRGIRLYFQGQNPGVARSFAVPFRAGFAGDYLLSLAELAGASWIWAQRPAWRWFVGWLGLSFASIVMVSGVFGLSTDPERLFISLHLCLVPMAAGLACSYLPRKRYALALGTAAAFAVLLPPGMTFPRLKDGVFWSTPARREAYASARTIHETELAENLHPRLLAELHDGKDGDFWFYKPLELSVFDRLLFDRRPEVGMNELLQAEGNPSIFQLPPDALLRYLEAREIGWIVVQTPRAKARLRKIAEHVGDAGSTSLFSRGLPPGAVKRCAKDLERWNGLILREP